MSMIRPLLSRNSMSSGISVFFIHIVTLVGAPKSNSIPASGARLRRNISPCSICGPLSASSMVNLCGPFAVVIVNSDVLNVSSACAEGPGQHGEDKQMASRQHERSSMPASPAGQMICCRGVTPLDVTDEDQSPTAKTRHHRRARSRLDRCRDWRGGAADPAGDDLYPRPRQPVPARPQL